MLTNTLSGPVFAIFLLGLHTRMNSTCALIALIAGLLFGLFVFFVHFQDSDVYPSIGIGFEDCVDYFCYKRSQYCAVDRVTKNRTLNVDLSELKRPIQRYPVDFDISLFKRLNFMYDGWLITFFTISVGLLASLFIKEQDKCSSEIEQCLATYMQKPISQFDLSSSKPEAETTYVMEDEDKNKEESKEESKETKDKNEIYNVIDINYLKRALSLVLRENE